MADRLKVMVDWLDFMNRGSLSVMSGPEDPMRLLMPSSGVLPLRSAFFEIMYYFTYFT